MKKIVLCIFFVFFGFFNEAFADVRLWVDKTELYANDELNVYLKLSDNLKNENIDFSPFSAHFDVINYNKVNDIKYDYVIRMIPKKFGMTMLPPLNIAGERTGRIMVRRYEQDLRAKGDNFKENSDEAPDLFIKLEQVSRNIYPYTAAIIRMKLYDGIGILNGQVDDPTINGVNVTKTKEVNTDYGTFRGRGYIIKSWEYSFIPTKMTDYYVNPVMFKGTINGRIISGTPDFRDTKNPFRSMTFAPFRDVEIYSETLPLKVDAVPSKLFPATEVVLSENYEMNNEIFVGDSIKRNINMVVFGSSPEIINFPDANTADGFNIYPSEVSKTVVDVNGTSAVLVKRTFLYVPEKSGFLEIPEFSIDWYNTNYAQNRSSSLRSRQIAVSANPNSVGVSNVDITSNSSVNDFLNGNNVSDENQVMVSTKIPEITPNNPAVTKDETKLENADTVDASLKKDSFKKILQIVMALVLVLIIVYSRIKDKMTKAKKFIPKIKKKEKDEGLELFYRAVEKSSAKDAETALIKYADAVEKSEAPHNLAKVGVLFGSNPMLIDEIEKLNQALYAPDNEKWDGKNLASLIKRFVKIVNIKISAKNEKEQKKDESLPSLYLK